MNFNASLPLKRKLPDITSLCNVRLHEITLRKHQGSLFSTNLYASCHLKGSLLLKCRIPNTNTLSVFTSNNSTAKSRDALYLCHIVLDKVVITMSTAHVPWQAKLIPQLTGRCDVALYYSFSTDVEAISDQSPVAQHADPTTRTWTKDENINVTHQYNIKHISCISITIY